LIQEVAELVDGLGGLAGDGFAGVEGVVGGEDAVGAFAEGEGGGNLLVVDRAAFAQGDGELGLAVVDVEPDPAEAAGLPCASGSPVSEATGCSGDLRLPGGGGGGGGALFGAEPASAAPLTVILTPPTAFEKSAATCCRDWSCRFSRMTVLP
jgi:hypothetical protein